MFTLTIDTRPHRFHPDDDSGPVLAQVLRTVAEHIEQNIRILPSGNFEWNTEQYTVEPGVTYTLTEG